MFRETVAPGTDTPDPAFENALPAVQTEREYLSALRRALIFKPVPGMPEREVSASMQLLQTRER